ncbi:MAG: hypothetical protein ACPGYV_03220 [Phycisphaeraceae bacterium]
MKSFYDSVSKSLASIVASVVLAGGLSGCGEFESPGVAAGLTDESSPRGVEAAAPAPPPQPAHLTNPPRNPRAALTRALDAGLLQKGQTNNEKLRLMLEVAGVPEASQVLVFSKTSLQFSLISPNTPRAIYFSDNCYVGYVPGGLVEYGDADPDPEVGSGMFSVDLREHEAASLTFDTSCAACHEGGRTNGRPGFFIRSVFPRPDGHVITSAGSTDVGHDTPLAKRWGGWYVTGQSGNAHHRGNQVAVEQANGDAYLNNALGSNLDDLSHRFNTDRYLQPTSDIVALMVLEHQVEMHNLLTQGRSVVYEQYERSRSLAEYLKEPFDPGQSDTLQRVIRSNAQRILEHLLFCDEVALTDAVSGTDRFIDQFRANRREDRSGRSLKDFNLTTRLFEYRCSYMVYSQAFDMMPKLLKTAVLDKLRGVLTGEDNDEAFDHLSKHERQAIFEILVETGVLDA